MRKWIFVVIALTVGFIVVMLIIDGIQRSRMASQRVQCLNNLRQQNFLAVEVGKKIETAKEKHQPLEIVGNVPAGTIFNLNLPPDSRLSWIVNTLPSLDQKRQNTKEIGESVSLAFAWNQGTNIDAAKKWLAFFRCPGRVADLTPEGYAITNYVGVGGVGANAPTLGLGPPVPNTIGCFQYDLPTPFELIYKNDGLSQTAIFVEVSNNLGPWIRGGPSTVRTLDVSSEAAPHFGVKGQFGGNHYAATAVAFADGSGRFLSESINPKVFQALLTIAGGEADNVIPD